ncbi:hypothetical protein GN956_G11132 [Arapaima gigas]
MGLLHKVNSTHFNREKKAKVGLQESSMQPLGSAGEQQGLRPLEQYVRKRRVRLSPVPSHYSEPVPLWHRKCVTGVLPKLAGYGFWRDETKSTSRIKRSRGFAKMFNSGLTLPPLSANNDALRAGLMVRGSSCLHVSTFPPINTVERPPSRAGCRELERHTGKERRAEGEAKQGKSRPQPPINSPSTCLNDTTDSKVKLKDNLGDHASERSGTFRISLGITLPKHRGTPAGVRPLNAVSWKES